jgi:hypothetical protein
MTAPTIAGPAADIQDHPWRCPCPPCHTKRCRYKKQWRLNRARGKSAPLTDAAEAVTYLRELLDAAWTRTQIGYASGVDHSYIANLLGERSEPAPAKLRVETAAAILALRSADRYRNLPDRTPVDPTGTRRRLQALAWNGHALERLLNGLHANNGLMVAARVTARNARLIAEAYDQLWNVPGGSPRTARRARSRGWVGPGAWDDDTIDDPRTVPDLGASADPVAALLENAEWLHTECGMPWDAVAAQLDVRKDTLHQYRTRERRRQEASTS